MKQYIFSSAILLILDILWISIYMKNKYIKQIRKIQNYDMKINIIAGLLSYTLMILGLCVFVIPKISSEKHLQDSRKNMVDGFHFTLHTRTSGKILVFRHWKYSLTSRSTYECEDFR